MKPKECLKLFLLLSLFFAVPSMAQTPKKLSFDHEVYYQTRLMGDADSQNRVTQYVRQGEDVEGDWHRLFVIMECPNVNDPKILADELVKNYKAGKPWLSCNLTQKEDGTEAFIDCLREEDGVREFNVCRIFAKNGNVVAYMFGCRDSQELDDTKQQLRWINEMARLKQLK